MAPEQTMLAALAVPLVGAALIALAGRAPNLRESVTLATALLHRHKPPKYSKLQSNQYDAGRAMTRRKASSSTSSSMVARKR